MAEHQTATCRECSQTISPEDTIVFGYGRLGQLDCRRPRLLSAAVSGTSWPTARRVVQRVVIAHTPKSKIAGGGVRVEIEGGGTVNITCPCGQTHEYRREEIKSVQAE